MTSLPSLPILGASRMFCNLILLAGICSAASAQPATPSTAASRPAATSPAGKTVARVYDIRDLLRPSDAGKEMPQPPVWSPVPTTRPAVGASMPDLDAERKKIMERVASAINDEYSLRSDGNILMLTASPEVHEKFAALLAQMSREKEVSVLVLGKVIRVSPEQDKKVQEYLKELKTPLDEKTSMAFLPSDRYTRLIDRLEDEHFNVITIPKLLVLNDEQACTASRRDETIPLPLPGGAKVDMIFHSGMTLYVRPAISADQKHVTFEARLTVAETIKDEAPSFTAAMGELNVKLADEDAVILRMPVVAMDAASAMEVTGKDGVKSHVAVSVPQVDAPVDTYIYFTLRPTVVPPAVLEEPKKPASRPMN